MSRQLSHDTGFDGTTPQIIGIHAGYLSQKEIVTRAHLHVANPPSSKERDNMFAMHTPSTTATSAQSGVNNGTNVVTSMPVTVPLIPFVYNPQTFVSKKTGSASGAKRSSRSASGTALNAAASVAPPTPSSIMKNPHLLPTTTSAKPRTLGDTLASNQFGTSDFRDRCETCPGPMNTCSCHVGYHQFPTALCPATHVNDVINICQLTCFACSRLLPEEWYNAPVPVACDVDANNTSLNSSLPNMGTGQTSSGGAGNNGTDKLNLFEIGQLHLLNHGQYDGGMATQTIHARKHALWRRFCNKKDRKKVLKQMAQTLTRTTMNAPECPHCGMVQPVELSACRDGTMSIRWDLTHKGRYLWQPTQKFWHTFRRRLFRTFARQHALDILRAVVPEHVDGHFTDDENNNDCGDVDIPYALSQALNTLVGGRSAPHMIELMITTLLRLHPSEETRDTAWLSAVMPFVMHDAQVIENTVRMPFIPATARRILKYMIPDDLFRIGKGVGPSENPYNLIFGSSHIPAKFTRPVIKKDSGSALMSTSGVTDTVATLIKMSTKLRYACLSQAGRALSSWQQMLRMTDDEFAAFLCNGVMASDSSSSSSDHNDRSNLYEGQHVKTTALDLSLTAFMGGDVRMCCALVGDDVWRHLSSLNYEVGTALDHRLIKQSMTKPHNSALTGSKNARNAVKQVAKKAQSTIHTTHAARKSQTLNQNQQSSGGTAKNTTSTTTRTQPPSSSSSSPSSSPNIHIGDVDDLLEHGEDTATAIRVQSRKRKTVTGDVATSPSTTLTLSSSSKTTQADLNETVVNPFRTTPSLPSTLSAPSPAPPRRPTTEIINLLALDIADLDSAPLDIFGHCWFAPNQTRAFGATVRAPVASSNDLRDTSMLQTQQILLANAARHAQAFGDADEARRKFDLLFASHWLEDDQKESAPTTNVTSTANAAGDNQAKIDTNGDQAATLWSACVRVIAQTWLRYPVGAKAIANMSADGRFSLSMRTVVDDGDSNDTAVTNKGKANKAAESNHIHNDNANASGDVVIAEPAFPLDTVPSLGAPRVPTTLPQPDQIKTLQFKPAGNAIQKQPNKTLEERIGGKDGLVRNNIITKRVNHSARVVLKPNANISVNCVGIPLRMCLNQTVPLKVTRANYRALQLKIARSRLWTTLGLYPDLGGVESVTTHTGQVIPVFGWPTPIDYLFDDEIFADNRATKARALAQYQSDDHLIELYGLPEVLQVGWTCEVYLDHGDQALISRPPILQRGNHNAHFIVPISGFAMSLNVCCMKGYNADCDGDALMAVFMQSISARTSIRHLMSIENNMICPRSHAVLSSLQLDALLGTCLMISENVPLTGAQRTHLTSCLKNTSPRRMQLTRSIMGPNPHDNDPRLAYGMLWQCCVPAQNDTSDNDDNRRNNNITNDKDGGTNGGTNGDEDDNNATTTTLELFESTLPRDFSYFKISKQSQAKRHDVFRFVNTIDRLTHHGRHVWTPNLRKQLKQLAPSHVVVIRYGRWICGEPSSDTLGTAGDSLVESLWRNYGKYFACDWLSDMSRMAQWYLGEVRGFTCAYEDIVLGGRGDWLGLKVDDMNNSGVSDGESKSKGKNSNRSNSKLSAILQHENERSRLFSVIDDSFDRVNTFVRENAGRLRRDAVSEAYERIEQYANGMILYGANMLQSKNTNVLDNNVTTMASTGAKGTATNWATMSVTLGNARNRGGISVGANIVPNHRNHPCEMIGERTTKTLGFINRGFCQGLTGMQFFQTSKEARIRTIDSSSPEKSGYIQTQVGVNTQAISVHYDGTVRNQIDEIIQLNYGGDGYDALHVKRLHIAGSEIHAAYKHVHHAESRAQLLHLLNLVLVTAGDAHARGPTSEFASLETLLQRGITLTLNVDLPTTFLVHSQHWHIADGDDSDKNTHQPPATADTQCQLFEAWCRSLLQYDADTILMPLDLMLAVRLYMVPEVFGPSAHATPRQWQILLAAIFTKYTQNMVDPGEAVGALACQSTNQPTTQLIMKSFKTDVAGAKEKLHISSGLQRLVEIFGDAESKASMTQIALHPNLIANMTEARLVAAMMKGTQLREWVLDTSHGIVVIDMDTFYARAGREESETNMSIADEDDHAYDDDYYDVGHPDGIRWAIAEAYTSLPNDKKPTHHLLSYFHLRRDLVKCPGIYDFVQCAMVHATSGVDLVNRILGFVTTVWTACLGYDQFGGVHVQTSSGDGDDVDDDGGQQRDAEWHQTATNNPMGMDEDDEAMFRRLFQPTPLQMDANNNIVSDNNTDNNTDDNIDSGFCEEAHQVWFKSSNFIEFAVQYFAHFDVWLWFGYRHCEESLARLGMHTSTYQPDLVQALHRVVNPESSSPSLSNTDDHTQNDKRGKTTNTNATSNNIDDADDNEDGNMPQAIGTPRRTQRAAHLQPFGYRDGRIDIDNLASKHPVIISDTPMDVDHEGDDNNGDTTPQPSTHISDSGREYKYADIHAWCQIVHDVGCALPNKLLLFGSADVGHVIQVTPPSVMPTNTSQNQTTSAASDAVNQQAAATKPWFSSLADEMAKTQHCYYSSQHAEQMHDNDQDDQDDLYQPLVSRESCWNVSMRCSSLTPFLGNLYVVHEYSYTSNLKEMYRTFGLDTNAHLIALEASRVLSSDGDVYVQQRHLRLLADVLTSEGRVFGLNQNGLSRRSRSSFVAQSSFEQISENMIKSGLTGRYDSMSHVIPNVVFGKRPPFIGSGICRVVSPNATGNQSSSSSSTGSTTSNSPAPVIDDYNLVFVDIEACQYLNIIDMIASASSLVG